MRVQFGSLVALVATIGFASPKFVMSAEKAKNDRVVKEGMLVSFDYTLTGTDGKVIESSKGKQPLKYTHGRREMILGLEKNSPA